MIQHPSFQVLKRASTVCDLMDAPAAKILFGQEAEGNKGWIPPDTDKKSVNRKQCQSNKMSARRSCRYAGGGNCLDGKLVVRNRESGKRCQKIYYTLIPYLGDNHGYVK